MQQSPCPGCIPPLVNEWRGGAQQYGQVKSRGDTEDTEECQARMLYSEKVYGPKKSEWPGCSHYYWAGPVKALAPGQASLALRMPNLRYFRVQMSSSHLLKKLPGFSSSVYLSNCNIQLPLACSPSRRDRLSKSGLKTPEKFPVHE